MRKLIIFLVTGLLWSTNIYAELINFEKCFQRNETFKDNTFKDISYFQDEHTWSVNTSSGKITNIIKYKNKYKAEYGYKDQYWDFDIHNYTKDLIVARVYAYNTSDNRWLENQNDSSVISYEVFIHVKDKRVEIKRFPDGIRGLSIPSIEYVAKTMNITSKKAIEEYVGYYHDIYICDEVEGLGGKKTNEPGIVSGTAFFINSRGYLLTNYHVVEGCTQEKITYLNKEYDALRLASDKILDLSMLKVDLVPRSYLSFSDSRPKKLEKIFVAGYPFGKGLSDDLKITDGIISSLKGVEDNSNQLQVSAPINHGNSGGPIVNKNGEVVAIAVSGLAKEISEGINFGIKSSAALNFLHIAHEDYLLVDAAEPSVSSNRSINNDELLKILEESTVYIYCELKK